MSRRRQSNGFPRNPSNEDYSRQLPDCCHVPGTRVKHFPSPIHERCCEDFAQCCRRPQRSLHRQLGNRWHGSLRDRGIPDYHPDHFEDVLPFYGGRGACDAYGTGPCYHCLNPTPRFESGPCHGCLQPVVSKPNRPGRVQGLRAPFRSGLRYVDATESQDSGLDESDAFCISRAMLDDRSELFMDDESYEFGSHGSLGAAGYAAESEYGMTPADAEEEPSESHSVTRCSTTSERGSPVRSTWSSDEISNHSGGDSPPARVLAADRMSELVSESLMEEIMLSDQNPADETFAELDMVSMLERAENGTSGASYREELTEEMLLGHGCWDRAQSPAAAADLAQDEAVEQSAMAPEQDKEAEQHSEPAGEQDEQSTSPDADLQLAIPPEASPGFGFGSETAPVEDSRPESVHSTTDSGRESLSEIFRGSSSDTGTGSSSGTASLPPSEFRPTERLQQLFHLLSNPDEYLRDCAMLALRNHFIQFNREAADSSHALTSQDTCQLHDFQHLVEVLGSGPQTAQKNVSKLIYCLVRVDGLGEALTEAADVFSPLIQLLSDLTPSTHSPSPAVGPTPPPSSLQWAQSVVRSALFQNPNSGARSPPSSPRTVAGSRLRVPTNLGAVPRRILLRDTPQTSDSLEDEDMDAWEGAAAMATLILLCQYHPNKAKAVESGAVTVLLGLLECRLTMAVRSALQCLASVAESEIGRMRLVDADCIARLVDMLEHGEDDLKDLSAVCLLQLAKDRSEWRQMMQGEALIPILNAKKSRMVSQKGEEAAVELLNILRHQKKIAYKV